MVGRKRGKGKCGRRQEIPSSSCNPFGRSRREAYLYQPSPGGALTFLRRRSSCFHPCATPGYRRGLDSAGRRCHVVLGHPAVGSLLTRPHTPPCARHACHHHTGAVGLRPRPPPHATGAGAADGGDAVAATSTSPVNPAGTARRACAAGTAASPARTRIPAGRSLCRCRRRPLYPTGHLSLPCGLPFPPAGRPSPADAPVRGSGRRADAAAASVCVGRAGAFVQYLRRDRVYSVPGLPPRAFATAGRPSRRVC